MEMEREVDLTENVLGKICRCENPEPVVPEDAVAKQDHYTFVIPGKDLGAHCKKCGKEIPWFSNSRE